MPRQTCKSSPWSGWHAGCHPGLPWGPSEPPSNDEEEGKERKERQENGKKRGTRYEWVLCLQAQIDVSEKLINLKICLLSITVES